MRRFTVNKINFIIIATLFLFNDICFGLGTQPGSTQPATERGYVCAQDKNYLQAKVGPGGSIGFDHYKPGFFEGGEFLTYGPGGRTYIGQRQIRISDTIYKSRLSSHA